MGHAVLLGAFVRLGFRKMGAKPLFLEKTRLTSGFLSIPGLPMDASGFLLCIDCLYNPAVRSGSERHPD
jgi:hypothetical protein